MTLVRLDIDERGARRARCAWAEVGPFDELVASFDLDADGDLEVAADLRDRVGAVTRVVLARRTAGRWTSVPRDAADGVSVDVDVVACARPLAAVRLEATATGDLRRFSAAVDVTLGTPAPPVADPPSGLPEIELSVPPLSQRTWAGVRPDLDGGGGSWCSPTSLAMVLAFHGVSVDVPALADAVYDEAYGGCGNWTLNAWAAAAAGLDAVVTRLDGLGAAEALVREGLPLVLSIRAAAGALPGFPLDGGTTGHLVVLAGLTGDGDPIVLDPAGPTPDVVRRVYPRAPFAAAWVGGSGGIAYVVRPRPAV